MSLLFLTSCITWASREMLVNLTLLSCKMGPICSTLKCAVWMHEIKNTACIQGTVSATVEKEVAGHFFCISWLSPHNQYGSLNNANNK